MAKQTVEQTDMQADRWKADSRTNRHAGSQIMEEQTDRYTQHTRTGNQVGRPADRRDRQEGK